MKHSFSKKPGSVIELEVELTQPEFEKYWREAFDGALAEVEIKGFRKGAAPKELAEQAVNREKVFDSAAKKAVRFTLDEIIKKNNWTVIEQPQIEITAAVNGLKYKGKLTVFPEVKLGNYKKIAHRTMADLNEAVKKIDVTEEELKQSLDWLRDSRAKIIAVNREAKKEDVVEISYTKDGKPYRDRFILGRGQFQPGFEDKLVGCKAGDKVKFSDDVEIAVHGVFEREMPEINDEFAKNLGKFQSVAELKESIRNGLAAEKRAKEKEKRLIKTLDSIAEDSKIDIPQIMVEKMGGDSKKVANNLVIYKIAQDEKLEPTKEEIEKEMEAHLGMGAGIDKKKLYDYIYGILQNRKVFEFLEQQ